MRMLIYRKRICHQATKNYQLNLFDPDNGQQDIIG